MYAGQYYCIFNFIKTRDFFKHSHRGTEKEGVTGASTGSRAVVDAVGKCNAAKFYNKLGSKKMMTSICICNYW